jgi:hypothetical protein
MPDGMRLTSAEKMMILVVVVCLVAILAVIAMHLGVVPGCKATKICS